MTEVSSAIKPTSAANGRKGPRGEVQDFRDLVQRLPDLHRVLPDAGAGDAPERQPSDCGCRREMYRLSFLRYALPRSGDFSEKDRIGFEEVILTIRLMQGNEAIAMGALAAGCRFYAGYPITPSTEVAEVLSRELPKVGGKFIQMEDEIASMAAIIGALGGRTQIHDRHQRARVFADAGKYRLCGDGRDSVRDRQRSAARTLYRAADSCLAGGCDAGSLGHARRSSDHRAQSHLGGAIV